MSHKTNRQIFGVPTLLGIATLLGLVAGLIGDDVWDAAAGLLLAAPLVVTAWYWRKPARRPVRARPTTVRHTGLVPASTASHTR